MLKHKAEQISFGVKLLDILICLFAFAAAYFLRQIVAPSLPGSVVRPGSMAGIDSVSWLLGASLVLHLISYSYLGFYNSIRQRSPLSLLVMTAKAFAFEFCVLGSMVLLLQEKSTSRYFFFLFLSLNYGLVLLSRLGAWSLLSVLRHRGYNFRRVLIVGGGQNAKNVYQAILRNPRWGYVLSGFAAAPETSSILVDQKLIIARPDEIERIVRAHTVDEVIFALDRIDGPALAEQNRLCHDLGIPARYALSFFDIPNVHVHLSVAQNIPFLSFYRTGISPLEAFCKRAIDVISGFVGMLLTICLAPWIALKIKGQSPGPILFTQTRVGENGRLFKCYKFRTMATDAEVRKADLLQQNQMSGPIFKIKDDPRIFPFGAFLRRTSLDELPQFWNVLRGEMSLVGTRPPLQEEVALYQLSQRRRLSIRPGLTGFWQVSGRSNIESFEDVLAMDLYYIDNWSLLLDLKIIAKTLSVVLARRGAS